jgi:hypothetical protein
MRAGVMPALKAARTALSCPRVNDAAASTFLTRFAAEADDDGAAETEQEQLFYEFRLDEVVPGDHLVREVAAVLDLTWVRAELASY